MGHSASCPVIVELAARERRVRGLVLVGPTTDPTVASWPRILLQWLRTAPHESLWEAPVLFRQYRRTGVVSLLRGMDRLRRHRTDTTVAGLDVPVIIIRGEHDHIASASWCDELAARSGGSVTTGPGAGHMVPLTHPHLVGDAVEQVLRRPGVQSGP